MTQLKFKLHKSCFVFKTPSLLIMGRKSPIFGWFVGCFGAFNLFLKFFSHMERSSLLVWAAEVL